VLLIFELCNKSIFYCTYLFYFFSFFFF